MLTRHLAEVFEFEEIIGVKEFIGAQVKVVSTSLHEAADVLQAHKLQESRLSPSIINY